MDVMLDENGNTVNEEVNMNKVPYYLEVNQPEVCRIIIDVEDIRPLGNDAVLIMDISEMVMKIIGNILKCQEEEKRRIKEKEMQRIEITLLAENLAIGEMMGSN